MPDGRCGILLLLVLGACRRRLLQLILAAARCFLHARLLQHLRCGDVLLLVLDDARRLPRVLPFAAAHARHSTWPLATTPARHPTWRVAAHARLSVLCCLSLLLVSDTQLGRLLPLVLDARRGHSLPLSLDALVLGAWRFLVLSFVAALVLDV